MQDSRTTHRVLGLLLLAGFATSATSRCTAQTPAQPLTNPNVTDRIAAGNAPDDPGPLAVGLSHDLNPKAVQAALRKVAHWQLAEAQSRFNRQWTFSTLYDGLLAASAATGDPRYAGSVRTFADASDWQLAPIGPLAGANDIHMGLSYLALDPKQNNPQHWASTRLAADAIVARPDSQYQLLWWWCDALYMAPPVLARMYGLTHDRKYLEAMNREWELTAAVLYDRQMHLYTRDILALVKTEKNGKKLFWSRGNGWVLAGLVSIIDSLPRDEPVRARYIAQFKDIMTAVAETQGEDGMWRTRLLDPQSYATAEISGTAFFTYAMAWGINEDILPASIYKPRIERAWSAMLGHVYENGRLGLIQPVSRAPGEVAASSSYVYGVGAFLLAGAEIERMVKEPHKGAR